MAFDIRRLGPGDEAVLEAIALQAPDFDLAHRSEPDVPLAPEHAHAYLTHPAVLHWVAESGGEVAGEMLCHVLPLPHGAGRELLLYSIGVRSAHRRQGVGRALIATMLEWAREAGVPLIWVLADNPGAEAFYAACGFARGGEHDQGVLYTCDTPQ